MCGSVVERCWGVEGCGEGMCVGEMSLSQCVMMWCVMCECVTDTATVRNEDEKQTYKEFNIWYTETD